MPYPRISHSRLKEKIYYQPELDASLPDIVMFSGTQLAGGTTPPDQVIRGNNTNYAYDISDDSKVQCSVPNEFCGGTVMVEIVWSCNETYAANSGEARWQLDYEFTETDGTQAIGAGATGTIPTADINLPAAANSPLRTRFTNIAGSNIAAGDIMSIKISRIALAGGADPVQKPEIEMLLVHFAPPPIAYGDFIGLEMALTDAIPLKFQVPETWEPNTNIRIKIGILVNENYAVGSAETNWQMTGEYLKSDGTEAVGAGTSFTETPGDQNIPATAQSPVEITMFTAVGKQLAKGDIIAAVLSRIALVGGTNPVGQTSLLWVKAEWVDHPTSYIEGLR